MLRLQAHTVLLLMSLLVLVFPARGQTPLAQWPVLPDFAAGGVRLFVTDASNGTIYALRDFDQNGDCNGPDTTGSTGHKYFTTVRCDAGVFESHNAQHGGIAGRPDCHCLGSAHPGGHLYQPVSLDPGPLCKATGMPLTNAPTVQNNCIAGLEVGIVGC